MDLPHSRDIIKKWVIGWENLRDDIFDAGINNGWNK